MPSHELGALSGRLQTIFSYLCWLQNAIPREAFPIIRSYMKLNSSKFPSRAIHRNKSFVLISVPSQPPTDLTAYNTSSTTLQVAWGEVPDGFVHGILQGYRVFYKRTGNKNDSYINSTTFPNERKLHITGLEKFTAYSLKVLAFTRKGDGVVSVNISVLTDEDGKRFKFSNVFAISLR